LHGYREQDRTDDQEKFSFRRHAYSLNSQLDAGCVYALSLRQKVDAGTAAWHRQIIANWVRRLGGGASGAGGRIWCLFWPVSDVNESAVAKQPTLRG
jgi:hypothetical protein